MLIETVPPTWRFMGRTPRILNWPAVYDEGQQLATSIWLAGSRKWGLDSQLVLWVPLIYLSYKV